MTIEQLIMSDTWYAVGILLMVGSMASWGCFCLGKEIGKKRGVE